MTDPAIPAPATDDLRPVAASTGFGEVGDLEGGERLECGTDPGLLLEQVCQSRGEQLSPHQQRCPFCQAELERDRTLWAPIQALGREPVRAPEGMLSRVMAWVRSVTADPGTEHVDIGRTGAGVQGRTWVTAQAIARTSRTAAETVDGVQVALSRVVPPGARQLAPTRTSGGPGPGSMVVEVTVAADYGRDLQVLGTRVTVEVSRAVEVLLGAAPDTVSVHIDDVDTAVAHPA